MKIQCKVCGNADRNNKYIAREMMFGFRDQFVYFECARCGCLQIAEIPKSMSKYYPTEYYSFESAKQRKVSLFKRWLKQHRNKYGVTGKGTLGRFLFGIFPRLELLSLQKVRIDKHSRVLDVGAGNGSLVLELWNTGYMNVLGIDPLVDQSICYPGGPTVLKTALDGVTGKWDVIMFHHSFEHIADQAKTLLRCNEILNPDGVCLIRMPTVSSYAWRKYRTNWVQLDAPRHFVLHTIKSMEALAKGTGFKLTSVVYDSTEFQFWGSEQYVRDIPLHHPKSYKIDPSNSIFSTSEIREFRRQAHMLNARGEGDQAAFYLEK